MPTTYEIYLKKTIDHLKLANDWVARDEILAVINRQMMRDHLEYNDQLAWNIYNEIKRRVNVGCIFEAGPTDMYPNGRARGEYVRWYNMTKEEIDKIKRGLDAFDEL